MLALEDMGREAAMDQSLVNSSAQIGVTTYVKFAEEISFARPVPKTSKKQTIVPHLFA